MAENMDPFERARQLFLAGLAAQQAGNATEAERCYRAAEGLMPDRVSVLTNLGALLAGQNRLQEALTYFKRIIRLEPQNEMALDALAEILRSGTLSAKDYDAEIELIALQIFREGPARPESVMHVLKGRLLDKPAFQRLIEDAGYAWPRRLTAEELARHAVRPWRDPLLVALLEATPITDLAIEKVLVSLRRDLLFRVIKNEVADDMAFGCALAQQCFINEYLYPVAADERDAHSTLRHQVETAIARGEAVPHSAWLALGCYAPLHLLAGISQVSDQDRFDPALEALWTLQVRQPREEVALRPKVECLTPVDDELSRKVRQQYEENPYPRWIACSRTQAKVRFADWVAVRCGRKFPRASTACDTVTALTAGCGTGRQPIETAALIEDIDMLAVDLSLASLSYAIRKASGVGAGKLRFAQADILRLGALEQRFDFIDCTGVLHHMRAPADGLAMLAGLLKREGVMRLALYSETARRSVVAARKLIEREGIPADADGIRACREMIMRLPKDDVAYPVTRFLDFYSMSECRDLLFHVQEHRYTTGGIQQLLDSAGLHFYGFELEPWQRMQFLSANPDPACLANLACWAEFESKHPDFFASMYLFWVGRQP